MYTAQQNKAKEAIVKANVGTAQTLVQSEMADGPIAGLIGDAIAIALEGGMHNPFDGAVVVTDTIAALNKGAVYVSKGGAEDDGTWYLFQGLDAGGAIFGDVLTARR